MLIGKYKYAMNSRNRVFLPAKFRSDLGERCILSKDLIYNCLNIYSFQKWEEFSEKIESLPTLKMKDARQLIYSNSDEAEVDSQGRIILNRQLCEDTGILNAKEVMIAGAYTHAQIWSLPEWEEFNSSMKDKENKEAIIAELLKMGF